MALNDWMSNLPENLHAISICNLAIPGTHDSLSYSINPKSLLSPDAPKIAKILNKYLGPVLRKVVYNWGKTQSASLKQQLEIGIRYFDIRAAVNPLNNTIYSCHSLFGMDILDALNGINSFLDKHPKEIVILDFQHFYKFVENTHEYLSSAIKTIFGGKLSPIESKVTTITLNWLWEHRYQTIVIYRDDYVYKIPQFWTSDHWQTPWPNTTNIDFLLKFLNIHIKVRPKNAGYVSQCVLTPSMKYIARHIFSTLRNTCCHPCNMAVDKLWLKHQRPGTFHGVNVIIADFVTMADFHFSPTIVQLNYILSHHICNSMLAKDIDSSI